MDHSVYYVNVYKRKRPWDNLPGHELGAAVTFLPTSNGYGRKVGKRWLYRLRIKPKVTKT